MSEIDEWGRVLINADEVFDLLNRGIDPWKTVLRNSDENIAQYNSVCAKFSKNNYILEPEEIPMYSPEDEHRVRSSLWLVPDEYKIDVLDYCIKLCDTDIEKERVRQEIKMFEERDMIPILQLMIYLVDSFRKNGVVWGVGRGSSVASYVLYKIGIHKIDSIKYDLDIREFLKD